jgi:membrane associated rhomboid family serine protease
MSLYFVGTVYERFVGRARFLYVYLVAGVGGSVVSLAAINDLAAGASGAIFGIFGALGTFAFLNRSVFGNMSRRLVNSVVGLSALNLALPLIDPQIDGWAHFGGLLTGILAGVAAGPWLSVMAGSADGSHVVRERREEGVVGAFLVSIPALVLLSAVLVIRLNPLGV